MSQPRTSTVQTVMDALRTGILEGTYRVGTSLPSEQSLATQLNVSRGSIRKAIDNLIQSGELARRPHSSPVVSGRASRVTQPDQTDVYIWLAQTVRENTSLPFLQAISAELAGTPYRMVTREPSFFVTDVVRADERTFLQDLLKKPHVAGAIIWRDAFADHSEEISELIKRGIPLVFVDSVAPNDLPTDHVGTSNIFAAKQCVKHLLNHGHRRIVCVTDSVVPTALAARVRGYWSAMRQAGLDSESHSDLYAECIMPLRDPGSEGVIDPLGGVYAPVLGPSRFYADLAHQLVDQILAIDPLPTALFVAYDVLAFWICANLEGRGIRIPQDMSVVGFDYRARYEPSLVDFLDTASQDFEGFGRHAVSLLLDRLNGDAPPGPRHVLLEAPLVTRSSTSSGHLCHPRLNLAAFASG